MEKSYDKDFVLDKVIKGIILEKDFIEKKPVIMNEIKRFISDVLVPQINDKIPIKREGKLFPYDRTNNSFAVQIFPQDLWVYIIYHSNNKEMVFEIEFTHYFNEASISGNYNRAFTIDEKGSLEKNLIELNRKIKQYLMEFMY
jgi:hypothetical protein